MYELANLVKKDKYVQKLRICWKTHCFKQLSATKRLQKSQLNIAESLFRLQTKVIENCFQYFTLFVTCHCLLLCVDDMSGLIVIHTLSKFYLRCLLCGCTKCRHRRQQVNVTVVQLSTMDHERNIQKTLCH